MDEREGRAARRLLARLERLEKENGETAREEAQRLLLAAHLARLRESGERLDGERLNHQGTKDTKRIHAEKGS